jgi:hypothetical protein
MMIEISDTTINNKYVIRKEYHDRRLKRVSVDNHFDFKTLKVCVFVRHVSMLRLYAPCGCR